MAIEADTERRPLGRWRAFRRARIVRRQPLHVHLAVFALTILLPALLFSAFLILQFSRQQTEIAQARVSDTAQIIGDAVDREVYAMMTSAKVLASSSFLDDADLRNFRERSLAALADTRMDVVLIDPNLRTVGDTRVPFDAAPAALSNPTTVQTVLRTREPQVSDVYYSKRSADFVFFVAVPVVRGEAVVYVLAVIRKARDFDALLADRDLPDTWTAIVTDRAGHRVIVALATGGRLRESRDMPFDNPSIEDSLASGPEAGRDSALVQASYASAFSGWTTTVAVPDAVIGRPVLRSWLLLVVMGCALLIFSGGLAFYFGRRIAAPILSLAGQAHAIGRGEPALPVGTDIEEIGTVSRVLAQASRERREAEEQNRFLMREMTHRAKNQYALIAAIARRAAKESATTGEFLATLSEALSSLAKSADLLAGRDWEGASLTDLVTTQLKAFGAGDSQQIDLSGPPVRLNPAVAQTIGLALHELATNAAKYGALSVETGRVEVSWSVDGLFEIVWRERGGPPVAAPKRSGFGTLVTQKMTARGLGGEVNMDYAETGVVWTLRAPTATVVMAD